MKDMLKTLINGIMATRTHYDTRKAGEITYTFDGILEGKEIIDISGDGTAYLIKLSDHAPTLEECYGGKVIFSTEEEFLINEETSAYIEENIWTYDDLVFVALKDTELDFGVLTQGVWVTDVPKDSVHFKSLEYFGRTGELKKLDEKYLPDSVNTNLDLKMDKKNPIGEGSFSLNRKVNTPIGLCSFAEGNNTTASGDFSHAEGYSTTASGHQSHAEGWGTTASGNYSHAEGSGTTASGENSHAEGYFTRASGNRSHAEGNSTTASGEGSHAEGHYTTASGFVSHSEGSNTIASGYNSHAEGGITAALGAYSHAEGSSYSTLPDTITSGSTNDEVITAWKSTKFALAKSHSSHSEGKNTLALGAYSHAEGLNTIASGESSHSEGDSTTASGLDSHVEGYNTSASGKYSHAEGRETTASGYSSHAEGYRTTASGDYSHAEGYNTVADSNWQHVQGKYNAGSYISTTTKKSNFFINSTSTVVYRNLDFNSMTGEYTLSNPANSGILTDVIVDDYVNCYLKKSSDYYKIIGAGSNNGMNVNGMPFIDVEKYSSYKINYAHVVGNGTDDENRSNAHTLDWSGNAEFQGDVKANACGGENPISLVELYNTIQTLTERIAVLEAALNTDSLTETDANALVEEVFN